jgi:hypothetical protein
MVAPFLAMTVWFFRGNAQCANKGEDGMKICKNDRVRNRSMIVGSATTNVSPRALGRMYDTREKLPGKKKGLKLKQRK